MLETTHKVTDIRFTAKGHKSLLYWSCAYLVLLHQGNHAERKDKIAGLYCYDGDLTDIV